MQLYRLDIHNRIQAERIAGPPDLGYEHCNCQPCRQSRADRIRRPQAIRNADAYKVLEKFSAIYQIDKKSVVVEKPGLAQLPGLSKHVGIRYRYVLFLEPGRYSLIKIYREGRKLRDEDSRLERSPGKMILQALPELSNFVSNRDIRNNHYRSALGHSFLVPETNMAHPLVAEIVQAIISYPKPVGEDWNIADKYLSYDGRYIPIYHGRQNGPLAFQPDFKPTIFDPPQSMSPGNILNDQLSYYISSKFHSLPYVDKWDSIGVGFIDLETKQLVFDDVLYGRWFQDIKENMSQEFLDTIEGFDQDMFDLPPPSEFIERANQVLVDQGFPNISIHMAIPVKTMINHPYHRYGKDSKYYRENEYGTYPVAGYVVGITYNGDMKIGPRGYSGDKPRYGGAVFVRNDDRLTVVCTSWCQRVTQWSYNEGRIDMKFDAWTLADWFVGPFSQKEGLSILESPNVFNGKRVSSSQKANAIKNLKKKLGRNKLDQAALDANRRVQAVAAIGQKFKVEVLDDGTYKVEDNVPHADEDVPF